MIVPILIELAALTSIVTACVLLGRSRASHYRAASEAVRCAGLPFGPEPAPVRAPRPTPTNALSDAERQRVLGVLTEPRFADKGLIADEGVAADVGAVAG